MPKQMLLALDLGSTRVRALVVGPKARVRARAMRSLETRFPAPGRVEQDGDAMWAACLEVMREALARSRCGADELAGVGVVNQRGTALAWDGQSGRLLAPALSWQDQRGAARAAELASQGIPIDPLAAATKFEWLLRQVPAVRAAGDAGTLRLGTPDVWLTWKLTGGEVFATDPGNAGATSLFVPGRKRWSRSAAELFGIDPVWLPRVAPTSGVVGKTPPALLGAPVPVAARAGDQQAATFAQGVHRAGEAKLTLGTSAMLDVHTGTEPAAPPAGAYPLPLWDLGAHGEAYCVEGTVVTAGAAVEWLVELGVLRSAEDLDAVASAASAEGVVFVPSLQGLGTPYRDADARGLIAGLTRGSGRGQIVRALVEGLAHRCAELCSAMPIGDAALRVDGGLAQSDVLLQLLADLSGRDVLRAAETETTALGAALLAGLAVDLYASPAETAELIAEPQRFACGLPPSERDVESARWKRAVARSRARPA